MSQIAQILIDILAFEDPTVSGLFYAFFLGVPWLTYFIGKGKGQEFLRIANIVQKVFIALFAGAGILFWIMIISGGEVDQGTGQETADTSSISNAIGLSLVGVLGAFGLALGFGIRGLVLNFKEHGKTLIALGLFAVVIIISYLAAATDMPQAWAEQYQATKQDFVDGGAGMIAVFSLMGIAVLGWVGGEVYKLFR